MDSHPGDHSGVSPQGVPSRRSNQGAALQRVPSGVHSRRTHQIGPRNCFTYKVSPPGDLPKGTPQGFYRRGSSSTSLLGCPLQGAFSGVPPGVQAVPSTGSCPGRPHHVDPFWGPIQGDLQGIPSMRSHAGFHYRGCHQLYPLRGFRPSVPLHKSLPGCTI